MHLTLRQLEIFVAIAQTGSTTAGSVQIALSQSATSAALNELEAMLRARLFDRVGKRLMLNESGRALLPQARAMLDAAHTIERQFGVGTGTPAPGAAHLRLGASTTIGNYLLPGRIARYRQQHPDATVDVQIGNTQTIARAVAQFDVDIGFVEGPCNVPELRVEPWQDDALGIICAPHHPLALRQTPCDIDALRSATWLLRESGSGTRTVVEQELLPWLNHFAQVLNLGSTEAIKQTAASGLGLSCLSLCSVQDMLALGRLVVLPTTLPPLTRRLTLISHKAKSWSGAMRAFLELEPADPVPVAESSRTMPHTTNPQAVYKV